jgi:hypothetical protein
MVEASDQKVDEERVIQQQQQFNAEQRCAANRSKAIFSAHPLASSALYKVRLFEPSMFQRRVMNFIRIYRELVFRGEVVALKHAPTAAAFAGHNINHILVDETQFSPYRLKPRVPLHKVTIGGSRPGPILKVANESEKNRSLLARKERRQSATISTKKGKGPRWNKVHGEAR